MFKWKLDSLLVEHGITKTDLYREAKVRSNAVYDMCNGKTTRIELETMGKVIAVLRQLTEKEITLNDIIEFHNEDEK
ncbi:XRE family transcriptional regulator [Brevibacillus laterosporus]|nr:helix-turn-helix transcriptional regulator [Brevibacillus laterosporus]TPG71141.1 XRE family transcriptional regulator [Brevibacillus laterosporus]